MSKFEPSGRARLLELLEQQLELFEQIYKLCRKQTKLLGEEKIDELGVSLEEVHNLREKINGLHQESETLMQSYALSSQQQKDDGIEELAAQMGKKIEMCAKLNVENMEKIKAMLEGHSKKIDEQSTKRKGIGGYVQAMPNTPEMFDKKS